MKQLWTEKYRPDDIDGYVFRDAEQKAQEMLFEQMNDDVDGSFDFEEYDPEEFKKW